MGRPDENIRMCWGEEPCPGARRTCSIVHCKCYGTHCRKSGESKSSYPEAQALVWEALRRAQSECLASVFSRVTNDADSGGRWMFVSRRWDETSMWLQIPAGIRSKWLEWVFKSLESDKFLDAESVRKLIPMIGQATSGVVHVLSQRNVISWRASSSDRAARSQVVVPPVLIQRTSSTNIRAALDESCPELALGSLLETTAPIVGLLVLHLAMDHAASNSRVVKDILKASLPISNALVLPVFCTGHEVANTSTDAPGVASIITYLYQWSRLLRQTVYKDRFLVAISLALRAARPVSFLDSSAGFVAGVPEAHRIGRILAGITLFRGHNVAGDRDSPQFGWPADPDVSTEGRTALPIALDLLEAWFVNPDDFGRPRHHCKPPCTCHAQGFEGIILTLSKALYAAVLTLMPSRSPELGRWGTTSECLAFVTLLIFYGFLGPSAWLHCFPVAEADRLVLQNERASAFVYEQSKRLRGSRSNSALGILS